MAKRPKSKKPNRPARPAAASAATPEVQAVLAQLQTVARESPEGWGTVAQGLKDQEEVEPEVILEFLAREMGKEVLPLLRGAALDEDEDLAAGALKALPLLGTRAAGEALAEAYAAHPAGERARLAWQGVQALQARGINVTVPEPEGVRQATAAYQLREAWESAPDGVGSRELVVRGQDRYGVWQTFTLVWNDRAGIKDGFSIPISRHEWNEIRERNERDGVVLAPVPLDYARWSAARAREINDQTGFALDDHLDRWDEHVGPPPEDYQPPDPLERVRKLAPQQREELLGHLDCLLHEDLFRSWAI